MSNQDSNQVIEQNWKIHPGSDEITQVHPNIKMFLECLLFTEYSYNDWLTLH